jgi:hypothetical protein
VDEQPSAGGDIAVGLGECRAVRRGLAEKVAQAIGASLFPVFGKNS